MVFKVLTLFPEMFGCIINTSILGRALNAGLVDISLLNIRDYAMGRHKVADDVPYGGGAGMVMKPEPIDRCLCDALGCSGPDSRSVDKAKVVLMSPQGTRFTQTIAQELVASSDTLVLICGHYEGIDERISELWVDEEISIGDYVLTGGELAAMVVIDACARLLPGVLGHEDSALYDSFMDGLLDCPHYTRPPEFRGLSVPDVLLSGHHENIRRWRRKQSLIKTRLSRPDLLEKASISESDMKLLVETES